MKKFLIILAIIIAIGAGYFFYKTTFSTSKMLNPIYALPPDAAYIIEMDDALAAWKKNSSSSVWTYMKTNPFLSEITHYMDSLNDVITANEALSNIVASRPVLVSGHPVRGELEYFWVVDLKDASQFLGLRNLILPIFEKYYTVSVREYHGYEILEMYDEEYHETMYMVVFENLLIGSYKHVLVEASLDQLEEPVIGRDLEFIEVREQLGFNGMLRFYIQWDVMLKHIEGNFSDISTLTELSSVFNYSGFDLDFDVENETILLEGYTSMNDKVSSFYNMFHQTGSSSLSIPHIVPKTTSFYSGLGFKNSDRFSSFIDEMMESSEEASEYTEGKKKLEKFLDITFEEHFFSWIDDEMAAIQTHGSKDEAGYSLIIKSKDGEDAAEKLGYIAERIKKKTPVKFKQIDYQGYKINFMSVKGLFRLIFGKFFQKLDKPYYTIIDDYVIFSNHPNTLRYIIDSYAEGNTLAASEDFLEFEANYPSSSSVFLYASPTYLLADSKDWLDAESHQKVMDAKDYLLCFPLAGLQITSENRLYENLLALKFDKSAVYKNAEEGPILIGESLFNTQSYDSLFQYSASTVDQEESISPEDIYPDDLDATMHQETFENGAIRVEVSIKDGVKHGTYREYDINGNIILKGKFKNDQRDGLWREYDENGKVTSRIRYDNGVIK